MGKKVHEFDFRPVIDLPFYFHTTYALLEDFDIFDNFDHIFILLLSIWAQNLNRKYKYPIN